MSILIVNYCQFSGYIVWGWGATRRWKPHTISLVLVLKRIYETFPNWFAFPNSLTYLDFQVDGKYCSLSLVLSLWNNVRICRYSSYKWNQGSDTFNPVWHHLLRKPACLRHIAPAGALQTLPQRCLAMQAGWRPPLWASWGQAPCLPWHPAPSGHSSWNSAERMNCWLNGKFWASCCKVVFLKADNIYAGKCNERGLQRLRKKGLPPFSFWDLSLHSLLGRGHYSGNCEL